MAPVSHRSLLLRSSSLRLELFEERTETRASQLLDERLQLLNLRRKSLKNVRCSSAKGMIIFHCVMRPPTEMFSKL